MRPTVHTLSLIAARLGVLVLDLVTFPEQDLRQKLVERSRSAAATKLRRALEALD